MTAITHPMLRGHLLRIIIPAFGEARLLRGTDSTRWGSPQWQSEG